MRADSIGLWIWHVARRLARNHQVTVCSRGRTSGQRLETECEGVAFILLPEDIDRRSLSWSRRRRRLGRLLGRRSRPESPYYLDGGFYCNYIDQSAQEIARHDVDIISLQNFSNQVPLFRRRNPGAGIQLHMHCNWLAQLSYEKLSYSLDRVDYVSGCSEFIVNSAVERFPAMASKSFVVSNGYDDSLFNPNPGQAGRGDPEILFVGRLSPEKGIHVLLEAFNQVVEHVPDARLKLIGHCHSAPREFMVDVDRDPLVRDLARFYHRSDPGYYESFLKSIPSAAAGSRIQWIADTPQSELPRAYREAAVFVFPSVVNEAFGMPLVEAMACARPVVSTFSGGVPEFVENGKHGILVNKGQVNELAQALVDLLLDDVKRREMGQAGHLSVRQRFSWESMADDLENALNLQNGHVPVSTRLNK